MPDISAALLLLKKPIEALAKVAAERFRNDLEAIKADAKIKTLYQKLSATQKIKTIWDVDKPRSLSSFYYPAKIRTKEGAHQQLSSIDELPANAIILSGTAGQGKSILLRHLLGKEIRSGERIPLFIELRKVPLHGLDAFLRETFLIYWMQKQIIIYLICLQSREKFHFYWMDLMKSMLIVLLILFNL